MPDLEGPSPIPFTNLVALIEFCLGNTEEPPDDALMGCVTAGRRKPCALRQRVHVSINRKGEIYINSRAFHVLDLPCH